MMRGPFMRPYIFIILCLCLSPFLAGQEAEAPKSTAPEHITLSNEMAEVVINVQWAEVTDFKLIEHHPLKLDERLGGNPELDPEGPLSVLGSFHDKFSGHNALIVNAKGSWALASHDPKNAVFKRTVNGLEYTLSYALDDIRPTVHCSWDIKNPSDKNKHFKAQLSAITGVHQDLARNDAYFNGVYYYEDDSLEYLGFPEYKSDQELIKTKQKRPLLSYTWNDASKYISIRSRFFAGIWTLTSITKGSATEKKEDNQEAEGNAALSLTDGATVSPIGGHGVQTQLISAAFMGGPQNARQHQARVNAVFFNSQDKDNNLLLQVKAQEAFNISWQLTATSMNSQELELLTDEEADLEFASAWYRFFRLISNVLLWLLNMMNAMYEAMGLEEIAYGLAVITTTAIVKGLLHRVTYKQQYSMMKMQQLAPELKAIQAKYKDDRQQMAMKQMELWRKNGVNPFGGCLPLLIQMPIFFALFQVFNHAADMRGHGFLWVTDLTLPDQTIPLGFIWPILGSPASLNLLPMIYLPVALFQSMSMKMTAPNSGDKQKDEMQATMQKMFRWMPIFFFVFIYFFAAGLVLYITISSLWSLIEIRLIRKQLGLDQPKEDGDGPAPAAAASTETPKKF